MPPRPPVTTLVIHTWKEHGKPRPLSNHRNSAASAKARISRSISHDAHLASRLRTREEKAHNSTSPFMRSVSVQDGLLLSSKLATAAALTPNPIREHAGCDQHKPKPSNKYHSPNSLIPIEFSPMECHTSLPSIPEMEPLPMNFLKGRSLAQLHTNNNDKPR